MKNKAVSKAMRKVEDTFTELKNEMLRIVKGLKTDSKEVECIMCMKGSDGKLCFSEKERGKVWKD